MIATSLQPHPSRFGQRRAIWWLGVFSLVLALAAPILTIQMAEAAQTRTAQQGSEPCDLGFVLNERTGLCEPLNLQIAQQCAEGAVLNQRTGECEPERIDDFQQTPDPCPEGEQRQEETGECIPIPSNDTPVARECPAGTILNQQTGQCDVQEAPAAAPSPTDTPMLGEPPIEPVNAEHTLSLTKRICSADINPAFAHVELEQLCPVAPDIEFTLFFGGGATSTTVTDANGVITWLGLPAGDYEVQETEHAGYGEPSIYCWQQGVELAFPVVAIDGRIEGTIDPTLFPLEESLNYTCSWINFEDDGANTVTVKKSNCPLGAPYEELGIGLIEVCTDFQAGVEFTISWEGFSDTQATAANGEVYWAGVPEGPIAIQETIPDGYGDPYVYCRYVPDDPAAPSLWFAFGMVEDGLVEWTMDAPAVDLECEWLNIPDDEGNGVTVLKWLCPVGTGLDEDIDWYFDNCTEAQDGVEFTLTSDLGIAVLETVTGTAEFEGLSAGVIGLQETIPPGFGEPVVVCGEDNEWSHYPAPAGAIDYEFPAVSGSKFVCQYFNIPEDDRSVTVHKWYCSSDVLPASEDFVDLDDWSNACAVPAPDVEFTLTDGNGDVTKSTSVAGSATWEGPAVGDITLTEHTPPGFHDPVVFCSLDARFEDGAAYAEGPAPYMVVDRSVSKTLDYAEFEWVCHFFNIEKGPGEITVNKWTCPPGYDLDAWDADPIVDCVEATDGIEFTLEQPVLPDVMQSTGNAIPGAVHFGDLEAGAYVVTETVPDGIDYVFVWDCVGTDIAAVHPTPLNLGNILNIDVAAGDSIVCNWYNVPDPEHGWLTVQKYSCWTETYISDIDCETFEFGASFELFDSTDASLGVGMTDAGGTWTWVDLDDSVYRIEEISHEPCHISISNDDGDGNAVVVAGEETVVSVYNCAVDTGGKIPNKYPNTGAEPIGDAMPSLQGGPEADTTPSAQTAAEAFYEIRCLDDPDENESSTAIEDEDCERGSIPERLTIDTAEVDHDVEILEIIDGVMQAPTGPDMVSWYKETGRLGEPTNMIIAGHLNWWGIPMGVFYHLDELEEGDLIEITGNDGATYVYEVQWVRQESNLAPPELEVVGPTDVPSLTLITCGGEWDTSISEYNERTVVRAVQVDVIADDEQEAAMMLAA